MSLFFLSSSLSLLSAKLINRERVSAEVFGFSGGSRTYRASWLMISKVPRSAALSGLKSKMFTVYFFPQNLVVLSILHFHCSKRSTACARWRLSQIEKRKNEKCNKKKWISEGVVYSRPFFSHSSALRFILPVRACRLVYNTQHTAENRLLFLVDRTVCVRTRRVTPFCRCNRALWVKLFCRILNVRVLEPRKRMNLILGNLEF